MYDSPKTVHEKDPNVEANEEKNTQNMIFS